MQLLDIMSERQTDDSFYDKNFIDDYQANIPNLLQQGEYREIIPKGQLLYKHEGDFNGLLYALKIPKKYHVLTMILNGILNTTDSIQAIQSIILPNPDYINSLETAFNANK